MSFLFTKPEEEREEPEEELLILEFDLMRPLNIMRFFCIAKFSMAVVATIEMHWLNVDNYLFGHKCTYIKLVLTSSQAMPMFIKTAYRATIYFDICEVQWSKHLYLRRKSSTNTAQTI